MKNEFLNKEPLLEIKGLKVKFPARKKLLNGKLMKPNWQDFADCDNYYPHLFRKRH